MSRYLGTCVAMGALMVACPSLADDVYDQEPIGDLKPAEEQADAGDPPAPQLTLIGIEEYEVQGKRFTRYRLRVTNWSAYPDDLFQASPNLSPIGRNTKASRTLVDIYSADGRRLYGFAGFSSAADLQRLWFGVKEGSTPPDKVYVVLEDRLHQEKYKSNVVSLSDVPQLRPPPTASADRYNIPQGGVAELLEFIENLEIFRPKTREEYVEHRRRAPEALKAAAQKILELEKDESSEARQTALRVLLAERVRQLRDASPEERQETVAQVEAFLAAKAEAGLRVRKAGLAMSAARALEYSEDQQLAIRAYGSFAELIAASGVPELSETAKMMEGAARRLSLPGKEMEITGTTLDGTPFDWSAYRGKVVLVDFWATWCGPCRAELPHVRKNYQRYHDRGFEVVGISLDRDRQKLERFLEKEPLPWVTLHESDSEKRHPLAAHYGVMSIPTVILVDREGKVVSLRARGAELDSLLGQLIGPPQHVPIDEPRWREPEGAPPQERELPEGLLLYMPFEENTFLAVEEKTYVRDLSGHKNHGRGRGVTFTPDGQVGGALVVDDGGLRLPDNLLNKAINYTVTAWIRRADDEDRLILYQERFGRGKALLQMDFFPPNGRPRAKVWNRRKSPANWVHVDGEGMPPAQWHFVTFTVTGAGTGEGTLQITVDGRAFQHNFQMLDVRDVGYGFVGSGKGLIDELAIFNRALSEEEIQALQQGEKGNSPKTDEGTLPELVKALQDDDPEVRRQATYALKYIGGDLRARGEIDATAEVMVPGLAKALKDSHRRVRSPAAEALASIGPAAKGAVPDLIEALRDRESGVRRRAANALGQIGPEANRAIPDLIKMLRDDDQEVRFEAALALGEIGPAALPELVKTLHDPEDPKVRALATLALAQGKFGASAREIVPELVKALQDREPQVRAGAATALKYIGRDLKDRGEMDTAAEVLVPGFVKALEVSDREVRSQAAKALGNIGPHAKDAIPALQAMLQDEGLREVAAWALERIRAEE